MMEFIKDPQVLGVIVAIITAIAGKVMHGNGRLRKAIKETREALQAIEDGTIDKGDIKEIREALEAWKPFFKKKAK